MNKTNPALMELTFNAQGQAPCSVDSAYQHPGLQPQGRPCVQAPNSSVLSGLSRSTPAQSNLFAAGTRELCLKSKSECVIAPTSKLCMAPYSLQEMFVSYFCCSTLLFLKN